MRKCILGVLLASLVVLGCDDKTSPMEPGPAPNTDQILVLETMIESSQDVSTEVFVVKADSTVVPDPTEIRLETDQEWCVNTEPLFGGGSNIGFKIKIRGCDSNQN